MSFVGIVGNESFSLFVYDATRPDFQQIDQAELFVGLNLLASIPIFVFNTMTNRILRWIGFVVALIVIAGNLIVVSVSISIPGLLEMSTSSALVSFQIFLVYLLCSLPVLALIVIAIR